MLMYLNRGILGKKMSNELVLWPIGFTIKLHLFHICSSDQAEERDLPFVLLRTEEKLFYLTTHYKQTGRGCLIFSFQFLFQQPFYLSLSDNKIGQLAFL